MTDGDRNVDWCEKIRGYPTYRVTTPRPRKQGERQESLFQRLSFPHNMFSIQFGVDRTSNLTSRQTLVSCTVTIRRKPRIRIYWAHHGSRPLLSSYRSYR